MVLEKLIPYIRDYLQKEWSDYWNVKYKESEDKIECVWSGIDSTKIEFTYDYEYEELIFYSNEHQPVGELVEMLTFLNEKVSELRQEVNDEIEEQVEM